MGVFLPGFRSRKKVAIDYTEVKNELQDFPLLVKFVGDTNIASVAHNSGIDIRFTSGDGITELPFERVNYSSGSGVFWVVMPVIYSGLTTNFYIYYNNPNAVDASNPSRVWNNHSAVLHLNDNPAGVAPQMLDVTGNGRHATTSGTMVAGDSVAGRINKAIHFDGTDDDALFTPFQVPESFSMQVVWKPDSAVNSSHHCIFTAIKPDNTRALDIQSWTDGNMYLGFWNNSSDSRAKASTSAGTDWHFLKIVVISGVNTIFYRDGNFAGGPFGGPKVPTSFDTSTATRMSFTNGTPLADIGSTIEEFRITNTVHESGWIHFEYHNLFNSDNELTFSPQENALRLTTDGRKLRFAYST